MFCGSSPGTSERYVVAARELGSALAARGVGLVYGGASVGLMGELADSVLVREGEAIGVIPRALVEREIAHPSLTELHVVETMHERKALMSELADAFVALPGGMGTLDELAEAFTWGQLGIHAKPCGLLDVDGFFEHLLAFLDRAVADGFLQREHRDALVVENDANLLLDRLGTAQPLAPKRLPRPAPPP